MSDTSAPGRGWAIWITGLPGCGKSSLARAVREALEALGVRAEILEMDARRKEWFPQPTYSAEERARAYELLADEAVALTRQGRNVIIDATAPALAMRQAVRERLDRFAEVHVRCSVETAMRREDSRPQGKVMAGLYRKALERKATGQQFEGLGLVPGVDTPFEENPQAEVVVDGEVEGVAQARDKVLEFLARWT
ncbi:adenylylsulfate kinase-like kinase [Desulfocurvibacter africanus PCS]|uniref:Adenylylsulfate kinase-like kinase n=1 Tax=Desulfocurvibacter africanus PCS TaxID=1262666 RepID=M5PUH1_DESAF|nr:adenylyl-sulfate kinase [Desulfocurvibacter africanus]EMG37977.1 adenylylsulfate kinase-like kinase [Desulfocurvibacter africanus PCS]